MKKLLQDTSKKGETPLGMRLILMVFYRSLMSAFQTTWTRDVRVIENSEARKLGLKAPCVYVRPKGMERMIFQVLSKLVIVQNRLLRRMYTRPVDRFRQHHHVGSIVTKRKKKKS